MNKSKEIVIIGAGFAGRSIYREFKQKHQMGHVIAFVDDDPAKIGEAIDLVPVLGPVSELSKINAKLKASEVLIAIPSARPQDIRRIYNAAREADFQRIRILPNISQIIEGEAHLIQTRDIDPGDLLGREPIAISLKKSLNYLRGKRVLITGAGGSIGSELARQLLEGGAQRLYLFGHGENSIYNIEKELKLLQAGGVGERATIVPVIGELRDKDYMEFILKRLKADVIFHCAAHKHVPLMEANPVEAIVNNVFGTQNLIEAAKKANTPKLVLISTDKAVEANSVYGVSKYLAEQLVLQAGGSNNHFMVVRFANVLGSRGSIIPLFKKQILTGGPVTVTHPKVNRYFMTIPEASSLVLQAGGVGEAGKLYILDMGEPLLIKDLAEQMIRFYGLEPNKDIHIEFIGLRPGEKLEEALFARGEVAEPTEYPKLNKVVQSPTEPDLKRFIKELEPICFYHPHCEDQYRNRKVLRSILKKIVPQLEVPNNEPEY